MSWGNELLGPGGGYGTDLVRAGPLSNAEVFGQIFTQASGALPSPSALQSATLVQHLADHNVLQFLGRPRWYELDVYVGYGELQDFQLGTVRTFRADLPGLRDGKKLMIMGREGGTRPGFIRLLCRG